MDSSFTTICFSIALLLFLIHFLLKLFFFSASTARKLPLPPGSLGWPYIGETFQLYSQNPNVFFASKQERLIPISQYVSVFFVWYACFEIYSCYGLFHRYGTIFKTHILGCPCVMISSPEAAKLVLVTKAPLFKPTFPASKERMLGKQAIFFHQGDYHAKLRKLVLRAFMPGAIKNIVSNIDSIATQTLQSWEGRSINTFQEMKTVSPLTFHFIFCKNRAKQSLLRFLVLCFPLFHLRLWAVHCDSSDGISEFVNTSPIQLWIIMQENWRIFQEFDRFFIVCCSTLSMLHCCPYLEKMKFCTERNSRNATTFLRRGIIQCP